MPATILFDLDDTLLSNDIDQFLPVYLKALGNHLAPLPGKKVVESVLKGTRKMMANLHPGIILAEAFDEVFYPALGVNKQDLIDKIDGFYRNEFPRLGYLTGLRPAAVDLINQCLVQGYNLAVATNPLFPRQAILHRLEWAGLSVQDIPFQLITSYEYFHFSKPRPAFLAEVIANLGYPEQVVMVGNSWEEDILPAAALGIPAFWLNGDRNFVPDHNQTYVSLGGFKELTSWLMDFKWTNLLPSPYGTTSIQSELLALPAFLDTLTKYERLEKKPIGDLMDGTLKLINKSLDLLKQLNLPGIPTEKSGLCPLETEDFSLIIQQFCHVRDLLNRALVGLSLAEWNERQICCNGDNQSIYQSTRNLHEQDLDLLKFLRDEVEAG